MPGAVSNDTLTLTATLEPPVQSIAFLSKSNLVKHEMLSEVVLGRTGA